MLCTKNASHRRPRSHSGGIASSHFTDHRLIMYSATAASAALLVLLCRRMRRDSWHARLLGRGRGSAAVTVEGAGELVVLRRGFAKHRCRLGMVAELSVEHATGLPDRGVPAA
jgi:hypothetical protein